MERITVFCGSSAGTSSVIQKQAALLGSTMAHKGIGLVYGGATVGLMGMVADAVMRNGGEVIGVLPYFLSTKEIAHEGLTKLVLVDSMHERKTKMNELCDGVIALPGGFGTLEEFFEMLTWAQLGLHQKPIGLLNADRFYDPLLVFMDSMVEKGFLKEVNRKMILVSERVDDLLDKMKNYQAPHVPKWIDPKKA